MLSFALDPIPTLLNKGETIRGINILKRLHELSVESAEAGRLFKQVATLYQRISVPRIGFRLQHASAVMPTKRIIDVGYDLTVVEKLPRTTPGSSLVTMYETYVSLDIPLGFYVELVPRSSIYKTGYILANNVGIIDPGYVGSVKVPLMKVDPDMGELELPMRIAQLILKPYVVSEAFDATKYDFVRTDRGSGGFGSTG